jgi:diguanylate cyclase (GGDEF)-like protein/PAS domain S-box-containing protein
MFWVATLGGIAVAAFVLLCGLVLWDGQRDVERQADLAANNVVQAVVQDISRNIEIFDLSLEGVISALADANIMALPPASRAKALFDNAATAAYLNAIIVLDEDGRMVLSSLGKIRENQTFQDRKYFKVHADDPSVGMYLSSAIRSRISDGEWILAISRRINKPDGSFGGVVVGTLQLAYFEGVFHNLTLGRGGVINIFHQDKTLIARNPFRMTLIGKDMSGARLFDHYPASTSGSFNAEGGPDNLARRFAFSRVRNLPLIVGVGLSNEMIYAPWRKRALTISAVLMALLAAVWSLTMLLARELSQRRRAEERMRESEERYRLLADNSSDAIVLRKPDGPRTYASPAFFQMVGRSPDEFGERSLRGFLSPTSLEARSASLDRLRAGEQGVVDLMEYLRPDGSWMWLEGVSSGIFDEEGKLVEIVTNLRDVTQRKNTEDKLAAAAATDGLTQLANRTAFDVRLEQEWKRAARHSDDFALLMIDIDCFKAYNDAFGHPQGDEAIKMVAAEIRAGIGRPGDFAARYGGEEFVVVLPETDILGAITVAENIRRAVAMTDTPHPQSVAGVVTVSIGLASVKADVSYPPADLVQLADRALYRAKRRGRNCTEQAVRDEPAVSPQAADAA